MLAFENAILQNSIQCNFLNDCIYESIVEAKFINFRLNYWSSMYFVDILKKKQIIWKARILEKIGHLRGMVVHALII